MLLCSASGFYAVCDAKQHGFYSGNLAEKVIRDCGGYLEGKKDAAVSHPASSGVWRDSAVLQKSAVFGLRDILLWKIGTPLSLACRYCCV